METMFMQNFGGTNKEYQGIFESGILQSWRFKRSPISEMKDFRSNARFER